MFDLLSNYFAGEISSEEKKILFQQLNGSPELQKDAADIQNLSALFSLAKNGGMSPDRQYLSFVHLRKRRRLAVYLRKVSGYAAIIALSVACTYFLTAVSGRGRDKSAHYQEFSTPAGQRAKVLLADGTEVWLNANSTLRFPEHFDSEQRMVELRGEAFFEVEQDKKKPFIVRTDRMDIEVTGTRFNVNAYGTEEYFIASLVEGVISVSCDYNPAKSYVLYPQQQMMVSDSSFEISQFENIDFLSWKEGVFVFDDMLLTDIIKKLELYYDVSIVVKNTKLRDFPYTGKFRQRDGVESVLRKLQIVYPFTYTKDDEQNLIVLQ
ncbi:MAG: FecR domain-containing protein [Tannerella sp.]|jgi:ferric-dicitrate binding protein FerR (iron transport regulator)|nr:FecR domain-containing protein [Tannerella sp.]